MTRLACLLIALAACGGSSRPVAQHAAPGDGTCHEAGGCEAKLETEPKFLLPDEDHPAPQEPSLVPAETREASCTDVATNLASIELGNYAEDGKLGPLVSRYRSSCAKLKLSRDERQCVFEATDRPTVTWCAQRMMPGAAVAVVEARECPEIAEQMRSRMNAQPGQELWPKQLAAMQRSCEQDRWTIPFRDCVRSVPFPTYITAYCGNAAPAPLRRKLEDRLAQIK
ncbi:MAG: hypothetical protein IPQ07_00480 [Myxococcales bacterium]|nr:hypothetical protein [Myxococcales bacterium]